MCISRSKLVENREEEKSHRFICDVEILKEDLEQSTHTYIHTCLYHSHFICIKACEKDLCLKDWAGIFCYYCCYRLQTKHRILDFQVNIHFYQIPRYVLKTGRLANTNTNTRREKEKKGKKQKGRNRNRGNAIYLCIWNKTNLNWNTLASWMI